MQEHPELEDNEWIEQSLSAIDQDYLGMVNEEVIIVPAIKPQESFGCIDGQEIFP